MKLQLFKVPLRRNSSQCGALLRNGEDLDAINELQFKFDKKNKELDKVGLLLLFL